MKDFIMLIWDDYGITCKPITTRNPQMNSIVERAHQTIGNLLRTFELVSAELDPKDPWSRRLSVAMFALWSTIHTAHKVTPMQLVFGRDAMLNDMHLVNWCFIQECRQNLIEKNNKQEDAKHRPHEYHINDKVMIKNDQKMKYGTNTYIRPY
eukprot:12044849-Ditylum_brightwellii.AAC.1